MINELRTFIAVCRHGTFAAAGERIGLTQSAVSSQIKRLEEALGFELFDRTGRSATLNAAAPISDSNAMRMILSMTEPFFRRPSLSTALRVAPG